MADSSKSKGLTKPLVGAKNEAEKESKKKRKRDKKFRAKFNENTEEKSRECSNLVRDKQNFEGDYEDSKTIGENSQLDTTSEKTTSAAEIGEDISTQQSEQMATDGAVQRGENSEEFANKDGQQVQETIQESFGEQKVAVFEQTKQEEVDGKKLKSKRASFSLLRAKKSSKGKLSSSEDKRVEDMSDEYGIWGVESEKVAAKDGETREQHDDGAKIEFGASSINTKSNDAGKSLAETQEKFLNKGNKGKKLKHLPSFGRNKKKADITTKYAEVGIPDNETQELKEESPVRSERSGSTRDEVSQSSENASNEPVLVHTSDSNAAVEAETGSDKKDAGVPKKKKSFLGLKRNKKPAKLRKSLKSEDEQKTKIDKSDNISASKENDDVSKTAGAGVETKAVEIEEKVPPNAAKTADLQAEETPEAAEANEGYINKETSSPDGKEHGATAAEEVGYVSSKTEGKSSLLRSLKLKSLNKSQQEKKKSQENGNSVKENEDGAKNEKVEQTDKGESLKPEQTIEVEESTEGNEGCAVDREKTSKAAKRKTSDLKNIGVTQAMKRRKEDEENISEITTDIEDNDEGVEEETVVQQQDQSGSEEISALQTEKNVKEKCDDEFTHVNEELSQQKSKEQQQTENKESVVDDKIPRELFPRDNTQEPTENKESEVEDENPPESLTRDDTQDEEVWNEADELCRTFLKTVKEHKEKKETQQTEDNDAQVEQIEENVEPSTEEIVEKDVDSPAEKQDMEQESEDESYGSAITVVSVEQLSSHEPKIGVEDTRLKHEGVSSETERAAVSNAEETSQVTESPVGEAEHKKDKPGESSETDISRVSEQQVEQETEPATDDSAKMRTIQEEVSSESEVIESKAGDKTEPKAEDAEEIPVGNEGVPSETETETAGYTEPRVEHQTEPKTEDTNESSETEKYQATESTVAQEAEHKTEDLEEISVANTSRVLASQVEQQTEPKTKDAEVVEIKAEDKTKPTTEDAEEIRAIHEKVPLESEVVESKPEDTEPTTESAEEILDVRDGISSEHKLVKSNAEEKTEPKNEDNEEIQVSSEGPSPENVTSETTSDVEITRKETKQKKKENWIMVQHLEMNEEVTNQLGYMLTALNAFKKTTACCTIV